ncbi:Uncharacterised protein [Mobiluncus mulieris]|uniref:Uncharacterized protein n=1 Tax=Mobiluncus mulieris TaxID=2052 RepID=A0A8G2M5K8_9ACTO|nr:Uncharacterised protein [Mobiluncus mulieris]
MRLNAPIQTRTFPTATPPRVNLATQHNSQAHSSIGTPSPHKALTDRKRPVSGTISLPLPGYFSPFPHGTNTLSVTRKYSGLQRGLCRFQDRLHESVPTRGHAPTQTHSNHLRGYHPLRPAIPDSSTQNTPKALLPCGKQHATPQHPTSNARTLDTSRV